MHQWKRTVSATAISAIVLGAGMLTGPSTSASVRAASAATSDTRLVPANSTAKPAPAPASVPDIAKEARSAVVMDAATGKVLYEKDAHKELPMASITKIMTMLLTVEAIDSGRLKWTDQVKTSEYAASMGGSQIFLEPGESMTVHDMVKGIAVASANDACVAIAEHLDGSEEAFVARMNQRAKQLGMDDTHFSNSNGLPAPNHYSSAHDIATMSQALLQHPEITKFTSIYSDYLRKGSARPLWLVNTNKLVRFYDGVDGLKTGFTQEAKYCLSATAQKSGFRVIAVVMGEPKPKVRNAEVTGMLNWAFANYTSKVLYPAGQVMGQAKVVKGVKDKVDVVTATSVGLLTKRGEDGAYRSEVVIDKVKAPIVKGQKVGELRVVRQGRVVSMVPLVAKAGVKRANFMQGLGKTMKKVITFGAAD
ncbi:D-alanyl-D-alanine carboxypeptidase [Alicyclobacillus fastidiosus]|uniref:serine-type D-Ala-D-Ala carboxypeptidase n=1 Tax=Alicyclobacillus fastidiosus TaxID=392011 RepID=A0ABY6ZN18_9BACL|nr:D-alanyl-D-alanine carboxypeptidase family protein [Alicyclobacillus fastidiosus]WAH44348.1 D-alanyl-D-alanine carboxypeptidase [Alicyclobacillus fastidiosus]GMA60679.1 D-alanyl-D-alanine carboxypeptidase [Alicyclobacillus fastidiosus]